MLSQFKWYRKLRGGYWVFTRFIGWQKVSAGRYFAICRERMYSPAWTLEDYETEATNG